MNWIGNLVCNLRKVWEKTIDWYLENENWLENITSGNYQAYYEKQYIKR